MPGFAGRSGAAGGDNVETLHPVETLHAYGVFYFRPGDLREIGRGTGALTARKGARETSGQESRRRERPWSPG